MQSLTRFLSTSHSPLRERATSVNDISSTSSTTSPQTRDGEEVERHGEVTLQPAKQPCPRSHSGGSKEQCRCHIFSRVHVAPPIPPKRLASSVITIEVLLSHDSKLHASSVHIEVLVSINATLRSEAWHAIPWPQLLANASNKIRH